MREGGDVAVLSIGPIGNHAIEAAERLAAEGISVAVYDMRFLKPLDEELLHMVCQKFPCLLTVENGTRIGGLGSAVSEFMTRNRYTKPLSVVAVAF